MWVLKDDAPDNTALHPIALASRSLSSAKTQYRGSMYTYDVESFHQYSFTYEVSVITDHKPLVAILKKGCAWPVTQTTQNYIMHSPIEHKNLVQTRTTTFQSRLAIKPQQQDRER